MSSASPPKSPYSPLPNETTIRVLLLAPGNPEDEIHCWLLPADLDADHTAFPETATERPFTWNYTFFGPLRDGRYCRKYELEIDSVFDDQGVGGDGESLIALPQQPFQRYTALSYVWGPPEKDPMLYTIVLNRDVQFPVTRNLHAALRALRSGSTSEKNLTGMKLWVDAICINQADHQEKENQLRLMRRVYRQAEEVVAFVPQTVEDQKNIFELMRKIQSSYELYMDDLKGRKDAPSTQGVPSLEKRKGKDETDECGADGDREGDTDWIALSPSLPKGAEIQDKDSTAKLPFYNMLALAQKRALELNRTRPEARFIEDFGPHPPTAPCGDLGDASLHLRTVSSPNPPKQM